MIVINCVPIMTPALQLGVQHGLCRVEPLKTVGRMGGVCIETAALRSRRRSFGLPMSENAYLTPPFLTVPIDAGELVIFEVGDTAIDFQADRDSDFVLGSAVPHTDDLVLGYYSVHTSRASLAAGERRIEEVRMRLQREGRL
jgi:hypothetical protein